MRPVSSFAHRAIGHSGRVGKSGAVPGALRGDVVPPKMKANPRKHELQVALGKAKEKSGTIPGVLQAAETAMSSKAWTGGTSGDFSADLTGQQTSAKNGGTNSVDEIQHAYDTCPAEIEDPTADDPGTTTNSEPH